MAYESDNTAHGRKNIQGRKTTHGSNVRNDAGLADDAQAIADIIRERRLALGISQEELGARVGVSRVSVGKWERGETESSPRHRRALARELGLDLALLVSDNFARLAARLYPGNGSSDQPGVPTDAQAIEHLPVGQVGARDLPVLGAAQAGSGTMTFADNGQVFEMLRRPPFLDGKPNAFAVYVCDESMLPRYRPGAIAYCLPVNAPPRAGDDVVIEFHDNRGLIKEWRRGNDTQVTLWQWNPAEEIIIPRQEIMRISRIVAQADIG